MEDLINALAYEIKQEIADRYFGFRKSIETRSMQYTANLQDAEKGITRDLKENILRMQMLFGSEKMYNAVLSLTGLKGNLPPEVAGYYPLSHRNNLFEGLKGDGFTRRRRYRNLVYRTYQMLHESVSNHRRIFTELSEEYEDICLEIKRFYRNNDLTGILSFLRKINSPDDSLHGALQAETFTSEKPDIERDLRIRPPAPVGDRLFYLPEMLSLKAAQTQLNSIIEQAYPYISTQSGSALPI